MKCNQRAKGKEGLRHRERPGGVHVGRNQRKSCPLRFRVEGSKCSLHVDICTGPEGTALRADENVGEVQLRAILDAHDYLSRYSGAAPFGTLATVCDDSYTTGASLLNKVFSCGRSRSLDAISVSRFGAPCP